MRDSKWDQLPECWLSTSQCPFMAQYTASRILWLHGYLMAGCWEGRKDFSHYQQTKRELKMVTKSSGGVS